MSGNMNYLRACCIWGNGDFAKGEQYFFESAERIEHARAKHPWPQDAADANGAAIALLHEAQEVVEAAAHEGAERTHEEFKDSIAVSVRGMNKEWEDRSEHGTPK